MKLIKQHALYIVFTEFAPQKYQKIQPTSGFHVAPAVDHLTVSKENSVTGK